MDRTKQQNRVFHQPIYEKIKNELREQILSKEIEPGSRITIQEIAKRYGVSQMPVREALQWLQGEGLLKITPHKGAKVKHIDVQQIVNLYEVRGAIAVLLGKKSLPRISDKEIRELERKHEEYKRATATNDMNLILQSDRDFHLYIYDHADNPDAVEIYDKYSEILGALRKKYGLGEYRKKEKVDQHAQLIRALRKKDERLLESTIVSHNEKAKQDLLEQMRLKEPDAVGLR